MQHAARCQITVCLTATHFKQTTSAKRKPVTTDSHQFTVQATLCFSVIRLRRTTLPFCPRQNKRWTLTNHCGQARCEPHRARTAPVERCSIRSEVANSSFSTTAHSGSCQDSEEDDYIVFTGIPTTGFGEQSTRAASRQYKPRRLPLVHRLNLSTLASLRFRIQLAGMFLVYLHPYSEYIFERFWKKKKKNSRLSRILQKGTDCARHVWKHPVEEVLTGSGWGGDEECVCAITSYPPTTLSKREFRTLGWLMM